LHQTTGTTNRILKDIPLSANLREKIRTFEAENRPEKTENTILEDDLREAPSRLQELEAKLGAATQKPDVDEILRYLLSS
jgi:hypothetical protein